VLTGADETRTGWS